MARALFISENFVKENSPVNGNVDDKYIRSTIDLCQRLYILPILGTALYNEIITEVNANSVSADNVTLLEDYIQDALLYYTLSEAISLMVYKMENKSIVKKNSDNSTPIDSYEVSMLRDSFKDKAEMFANRATKYLIENATATKYANYLDAGSGVDTIHPNKNNYTTGWVLDDEVNIKGIDTYPSERAFYQYFNK